MKKQQSVHYHFDEYNRFVIENFGKAKPFSNFFPGIAGLYGIPMWAFYTNRGQGMMSFGIEGKDKAIMEFQPANKGYRYTSLSGFRTFLKIKQAGKTIFYEPFREDGENQPFTKTNRMAITSHDLTITEENASLGLRVDVNYFTVPQEPFAALARRVTITNVSRKTYALDCIDGMPAIVPYGFNDFLLKHLSRTVEAWVNVANIRAKAPYYHLKVVVSDRPQVEHIHAGNFYIGFMPQGKSVKLCVPVVDPRDVFGQAMDFAFPYVFWKQNNYKPTADSVHNATPCAMSYARFNLSPGRSRELTSLIGHIDSVDELNGFVSKQLNPQYIADKAEENRSIIENIKQFAWTSSGSKLFDLYCGQTFLDNVLRGGLPISVESREGFVSFNVFSRKHGDPERDYNHFVFAPTYYSQGNGNYRDVNQNRRNDVWFNRDVKESGVVNFLNLIQADGYNPLVVRGMAFSVNDVAAVDPVLEECLPVKAREKVRKLLGEPFQPGKLLNTIARLNIKLKTSPKIFLQKLLAHCHRQEQADHGEGFWSDHWTYNLDLIERYLSVYPEQLGDILIKNQSFTFYHNAHYIQPRDKRYILTDRGCRQYHSVRNGAKEIKVEKDNRLRIHNGRGPVYHTTLLVKLLCLIANKGASLDPSGIGIEMEADKPNWYDALNGLPGLLGSSISETFELKRFCQFLLDAIIRLRLADHDEIDLYEELYVFIIDLTATLKNHPDNMAYWLRSNEIKEHYRQKVRQGLDGQERRISVGQIKEFLSLLTNKVDQGIALARKKDGTFPTYFYHEVVEYERLDEQESAGHARVWPLKFKRHNLPLFLEGFVHALRITDDPEQARKIYKAVRRSALFDQTLKMYKVNADLSGETEEIGRCRIFPKGWLENESIWSHMEYKYLLELLRSGLYEEFFEDLAQTLIPFQKPAQYGRSILENSSFIVSSAHPDPSIHGQGFVARLSGTTAEFVHIWLVMNMGPRPFKMNPQGQLCLEFRPILPAWLFSRQKRTVHFSGREISLSKNTYAFSFFGDTLVVYHNSNQKNTYGPDAAVVREVKVQWVDKKDPSVFSDVIPQEPASLIRNGRASRIDITLD